MLRLLLRGRVQGFTWTGASFPKYSGKAAHCPVTHTAGDAGGSPSWTLVSTDPAAEVQRQMKAGQRLLNV